MLHVTGIDLTGGRYVVYEELFLDGVDIAEHKDYYGENQMFYVPRLVASAYDVNAGTNVAKNDIVQLSGLKEGQNYYLSSMLMDKGTELQFINCSGKNRQCVNLSSGSRKSAKCLWDEGGIREIKKCLTVAQMFDIV